MIGGNQLVKVTLRNPTNKAETLTYYIEPNDSALAKDWIVALEQILESQLMLEKNFCFLGFPNTARNLFYLTDKLNQHIAQINSYFGGHYNITETFSTDNVVDQLTLGPNHEVLNCLHNHFEKLQGTVENLSVFYRSANEITKFSIRQLNNLCHEIESLILSQRKQKQNPDWVRPSQITTWLTAPRYQLQDQHRLGFLTNGYGREFGTVYMHWCQIGKTYFEVWRDEDAPSLSSAVCEAITPLQYYSGEFDIEWGRTVNHDLDWWNQEMQPFYTWLQQQNVDILDTKNSLGYLPVGRVLLEESFGTNSIEEIWQLLEQHLDIYSVEVNNKKAVYGYVWSDENYDAQQIAMLRPGYQYQSRNHNELV